MKKKVLTLELLEYLKEKIEKKKPVIVYLYMTGGTKILGEFKWIRRTDLNVNPIWKKTILASQLNKEWTVIVNDFINNLENCTIYLKLTPGSCIIDPLEIIGFDVS